MEEALLTNVHVTFSLESRSIMALEPDVVVPLSGSVQLRFDRLQPVVLDSVTVYTPGVTNEVKVLLSVLPSSTSENAPRSPVKSNDCGSSGEASFIIVIELDVEVFVNTQVMLSPESRSIVAVEPAVDEPLSGSVQLRPVRLHPETAPSVTL